MQSNEAAATHDKAANAAKQTSTTGQLEAVSAHATAAEPAAVAAKELNLSSSTNLAALKLL